MLYIPARDEVEKTEQKCRQTQRRRTSAVDGDDLDEDDEDAVTPVDVVDDFLPRNGRGRRCLFDAVGRGIRSDCRI